MDTKGYYSRLQVPVGATAQEIKSGYKKMALQLHPDKNRDDPKAKENFQKVLEAYGVLSDPEKRAIYDQYGTVDEDIHFGDFTDHCTYEDLIEMMGQMDFGFGAFLGGRRRGKGGKRGRTGLDREINLLFSAMAMDMDFEMPRKEKKKEKEDEEWETESEDGEWEEC